MSSQNLPQAATTTTTRWQTARRAIRCPSTRQSLIRPGFTTTGSAERTTTRPTARPPSRLSRSPRTSSPACAPTRSFLRRAVEFVAGQGIRQFLDVGTGLPTADNTHEVAQDIAPESRVVYVENDPIVLAHARALLTSTPTGATAYVDADARDTAKIIESAAGLLDFTQPVAVMALMVLQYIPDSDHPEQIVSELMEAVPSGSFLVISDTTTDIGDGATRVASKINPRMGPTRLTPRPRAQIAAYFDGLDLVEPGLRGCRNGGARPIPTSSSTRSLA